ncbi:MAG: hypothetical protein IPK07_33265 [Deltaproteobacteria bacterium]|nr:hypothetical protein [Deltaproteobacteria bacterium]
MSTRGWRKGATISVSPAAGDAAMRRRVSAESARASAAPVSTAARPVVASGTLTSRRSASPIRLSSPSSTEPVSTATSRPSRAIASSYAWIPSGLPRRTKSP